MAAVYANLIRRGRKTLEQVPELIREQVEQILAGLEAKNSSGKQKRPSTVDLVKQA